MHLLIVDGMNLVRRVYAAVESQQTPLDATLSRSLSIIHQAASALTPTHVLLVFEEQVETWRHVIWPDYKAGRSPMPSRLAEHLPELRKALQENGIRYLLQSGWEADDLIASLAHKAAEQGIFVTILSTDKGFSQLVNRKIQLCNHFERKVFDVAAVTERFGLAPNQLVDFWALTGDSTNNLPGVTGIGPKTAGQLLDRFGGLDRLLICLDALSDKQKKLLEDEWQKALLTRELVRLKTDIELGINLQEIRWRPD